MVELEHAIFEAVRLEHRVDRRVVADREHVGIDDLREAVAEHDALADLDAHRAQIPRHPQRARQPRQRLPREELPRDVDEVPSAAPAAPQRVRSWAHLPEQRPLDHDHEDREPPSKSERRERRGPQPQHRIRCGPRRELLRPPHERDGGRKRHREAQRFPEHAVGNAQDARRHRDRVIRLDHFALRQLEARMAEPRRALRHAHGICDRRDAEQDATIHLHALRHHDVVAQERAIAEAERPRLDRAAIDARTAEVDAVGQEAAIADLHVLRQHIEDRADLRLLADARAGEPQPHWPEQRAREPEAREVDRVRAHLREQMERAVRAHHAGRDLGHHAHHKPLQRERDDDGERDREREEPERAGSYRRIAEPRLQPFGIAGDMQQRARREQQRQQPSPCRDEAKRERRRRVRERRHALPAAGDRRRRRNEAHLLGRHALPPFAGGHVAAFGHDRQRGDARPIAKARVAVEARAHFERGAVAHAHGREHDAAIVVLAHAERALLAQRRIVADVDQVPAAAEEVDAAMQMHATTDARAEATQRPDLQARAVDRVPWHVARAAQHDPVAQIPHPVDRMATRDVATDEEPLGDDRERERRQEPQQLRARRDRHHEQSERPWPQLLDEPGCSEEHRCVAHRRCADHFAKQPCGLHCGAKQRASTLQHRHLALRRQTSARRRGARSERFDRARLVQIPNSEAVGARIVAQQRDRDRSAQRVAADLEEVDVGGHARATERLLPCAGHEQLEFAARIATLERRIRGDIDLGQRATIELAADRRRQLRDRREDLGHHVRRHFAAQLRANAIEVRLRAAGRRHHERDQGLARLHRARRGANAVHRRDARFDLAEFDAVSAQLDLRIETAVVDERAIGAAAHAIAGAVDAAVERVLHELLVRQLLAAEIAARERCARDAELAPFAERHVVEVFVEHMRATARHRIADRDRLAGTHLGARDGDRALRRAIAVDHASTRGPQVRELLRQRFAADVKQAELRQRSERILAARRAQQRGRRAQHRDALRAKPRQQVGAAAHHFVIHRHNRGADGEREPRLLDRRVVGRRRTLRDAIRRPELELLDVGQHEVDDRAMLDHHALGLARRARRVDQVGESMRTDRLRRRGGRVARSLAQRRDVEQLHRVADQGAKSADALRVGDHRLRRAVLKHKANVLIGKPRLQAHVSSAALQHAELRRVEPRRVARQQDRDRSFAAGCQKRRRDRRRVALQLLVGASLTQRPADAGRHVDCDAACVLLRRCGEDLVQQARRRGGVHAARVRAIRGASQARSRAEPRAARAACAASCRDGGNHGSRPCTACCRNRSGTASPCRTRS